jgi:hypothetical protein
LILGEINQRTFTRGQLQELGQIALKRCRQDIFITKITIKIRLEIKILNFGWNFYKRPEEYHVILTPCTNKGTRKEHLFPIGIEKNIKRIGKVRKSSRQIPSEIGNKSHINRLIYGV